MSAHCRHTQPGWVIVLVLAATAFVVTASLPKEAPAAASVALAFLGLALLLFAALTVEVDLESIRVWFGSGLIRKRIPLAEVRSWRAVRNPWYRGWGIRAGPRGWLWNDVELRHPPYLLIRLTEGFVFVNLREPERTRALFEQAARQWPERATAPRP
jgi:hypothetical protein